MRIKTENLGIKIKTCTAFYTSKDRKYFQSHETIEISSHMNDEWVEIKQSHVYVEIDWSEKQDRMSWSKLNHWRCYAKKKDNRGRGSTPGRAPSVESVKIEERRPTINEGLGESGRWWGRDVHMKELLARLNDYALRIHRTTIHWLHGHSNRARQNQEQEC